MKLEYYSDCWYARGTTNIISPLLSSRMYMPVINTEVSGIMAEKTRGFLKHNTSGSRGGSKKRKLYSKLYAAGPRNGFHTRGCVSHFYYRR